tara:strand:- start:2392 stop:3225 length:834 start_codon:yes stop_codon:yes gene_type:complete
MFGHKFYHTSLRKYIILFGTLFNDIHIQRRNSNDNVIQTIKCPLTYAPREKVTARLEQNPNLTEQQAVLLPRISFEMTTLMYDPARKLNTMNKWTKDPGNAATGGKIKHTFQPVPYDISFDLNIYTRYAEDATQILEQIIPFFTPEFTATIDLVPDMGIKVDVPIVLESLSSQDTYEGDFETRRALIWNLGFRMKGYLFGPIKETAAIRTANVGVFGQHANGAYSNTRSTGVKVKPGLLANGSPTTNAAASISANSINSTDNFGYIIDFEDYFDGGT